MSTTRNNEIWLLYSTFSRREEALYVARKLLEDRLIACATVHDNAVSLYRWEGQVREEPEAILMAKTGKATLARAMQVLKELHPYELPCIIASPVSEGFAPFLQWVAAETTG